MSFGYIDVPKDSISRFVSETAINNGLNNPDKIFIGQNLFIYLGGYVKTPLYITVEPGQTLESIIKGIISDMSYVEQQNRNLAYDMMQAEKLSNFSAKSTQEAGVYETPSFDARVVVLFSICIIFYFIFLLYKLVNKKSYYRKKKLQDYI